MRYLGLDLGTRTLGLAVSDKTNTIASSLGVLRYHGEQYDLLMPLKEYILQYDIGEIALGYPKNMNNSIGEAAKRSEQFKLLLEKEFDLPVTLVDERLSSVEAENILLEADLSRKKRKHVIDAMAAQIILETFIKRKGI